MMRILADTNILVSASFWKGNPYKVIRLAGEGKIGVFTSIDIFHFFSLP